MATQNRSIQLLLLCVLFFLCAGTLQGAMGVTTYAAVNVATVQNIQKYIERLINNTATTTPDGRVRYPLLPAMVRLSFHDCNSKSTGCDGCVNLKIAENKGLAPVVNGLEQVYKNTTTKINTVMSRADFWALAGLTAAAYGARLQRPPPAGPNQPPPPPIYIPSSLNATSVFKTGRKDCATAPNGTEASTDFPDGLKGQTETFNFFKNSYAFNANETVAILGAHTLGRAVVQDSGFQGPWVPRDNSLDNSYYTTLSNATAGWAQALVPGAGGKIQWQRSADPPPGSPPGSPAPTLIMMNADMCLYKSLTLNSTTGASSCTYSSCPYNTNSYQVVLAYAKNNTKWLNDFGAAFNKMIKVCGRPSVGSVTACTQTALLTSGTPTVTSAEADDVVSGAVGGVGEVPVAAVPVVAAVAAEESVAVAPSSASEVASVVPDDGAGVAMPAADVVPAAAASDPALGVAAAEVPQQSEIAPVATEAAVPVASVAEPVVQPQAQVAPQPVAAVAEPAADVPGRRRRVGRKLV